MVGRGVTKYFCPLFINGVFEKFDSFGQGLTRVEFAKNSTIQDGPTIITHFTPGNRCSSLQVLKKHPLCGTRITLVGFFRRWIQRLTLFSTTFGDDIFKDDFATFQANVGWAFEFTVSATTTSIYIRIKKINRE